MEEETKQTKPQAVIEIDDSGPVRIKGNFVMTDMMRGNEVSPGEVLLCTCGKSEKKPYCDDSHKKR